jgi:hypothetical protein
MNNKIANVIVDYIKDLTWIEKLAGLTQVVKISQNGVEKRYPVSCAMAFDNACVEGCYDELAPNSAYKSVVYFEDGGFNFVKQERNKLYYDSTLRLIAWLNYNKLGGGCGSTGNYIIDIISAMPSHPVNIEDLLGANFRVVSQAIRSEDIFSKYTYNVYATQYLMLPFDFFSLEIKTSFYIIPECVEDTEGCEEC